MLTSESHSPWLEWFACYESMCIKGEKVININKRNVLEEIDTRSVMMTVLLQRIFIRHGLSIDLLRTYFVYSEVASDRYLQEKRRSFL